MLSKDQLTTRELFLLQSELRRTEKSLALGYLMLLGGHIGLHRFYLQRHGSAIAQLILGIVAFIFLFTLSVLDESGLLVFNLLAVFLILPIIALTIWVIVDLFLLSGMVREWNSLQEQSLLRHIETFRYRQSPAAPNNFTK